MSKRLSWYAGLTALLAAVTLGAQAQPLTGGLLGRSASSGSSTPATCVTAGMVPIFLGSPVALGCDAGLTYDAATDTLTVGKYLAGDGSYAAPSVAIASAPGLGFYKTASNWLGFNGAKFWFVAPSGTGDLYIEPGVRAALGSGTTFAWAATPDPSTAPDAGLRHVSAGLVGVTDGSTGNGNLQAGRILVGDGTVAAPGIAFTTAGGTYGFSLDAGVVISHAGAQIFQSDAGGFMFGPNAVRLTTPAAYTAQVGRVPSATPLTHTLIVGESGAGTNIAGASGIIQSGAGTGSGAGSVLEFKTPTAHGSDAVAQTQTTRIKLSAVGVNIPGLATYADNTAALAGGLVAGDLYRTSAGVLMVTY